jgi:hypothetical protein
MRIAGAREHGILVHEASAHMTDVDVSAITSAGGRRLSGGIAAQRGASLMLERARVSSAEGIGVTGMASASVAALDLRVEDVVERTCACDDPDALALGSGLGAYLDAELELDRFAVSRSPVCGIHVAGGGRIIAGAGQIEHTGAAICADTEVSLQEFAEVQLRENGQTVAATVLPIPEPVSPLGRVASPDTR